MKNKYIVRFNTVSNNILYIRSYINIKTYTTEKHQAFIFTNKKTAADAAKYFLNYVLSEKADFTIEILQ